MHRNQDPKASNRYTNAEDGIRKPMLRVIRNRCHQHGKSESRRPWRNAVQLGLNPAVPVSLDNTRAEVCIAIGWHDEAEIHKTSDDDFVVLEHVADIFECNLALNGGFTLVDLKSGANVVLLFRRQPFDLLGEAWEREEKDEGDEDSQGPLKDEDPAPAGVALKSIHLADGRSEKPTKGTSQSGRAEEEGESLLGLVSTIPHSYEVETT